MREKKKEKERGREKQRQSEAEGQRDRDREVFEELTQETWRLMNSKVCSLQARDPGDLRE